jgi:hypothetical protein
VPAPDPPGWLTVLGLFAYGPAPGVELIPYFLGLLAWVGLALGAILLSPFTALLRRLRRIWAGRSAPALPSENPPKSAPEPPSPGQSAPEGTHDRA